MMLKMKSKRIALAKVTFGVLMAAVLTVSSGFQQDEVVGATGMVPDQKLSAAGVGTQLATAYPAPKKKKATYDRSWKGERKIYNECEQMPQFEGGQENLMMFVARGVRYPASAHQAGIQGKVFVSFVVEKDGSIKLVKITKSVDSALDAEAMRVIKSMPAWTPGRQKGKPVRVSFTMPINFVLQ